MRKENFYHPSAILNHQTSSASKIILGIHLLILLFLLLFSLYYPIETRIEFVGYYEEGHILLTVDERFFEICSNKVRVLDEYYSYEVEQIKPIAYEEGVITLWQIQLKMDLKESWKVNNHQFRFSFLKEKKTIAKRIISMIGGIYERTK